MWKDILGKKFRVGDKVAYPTIHMGKMMLRQAVICEPIGTKLGTKEGLVVLLKNGMRVVVNYKNCVILSRLEVD
jgi:hypothetical protein